MYTYFQSSPQANDSKFSKNNNIREKNSQYDNLKSLFKTRK